MSRQRHGLNAPFSNQHRVDRKRAVRLFLLNRGVTVFGFSPQIIATRERQQSNFELDHYRRDRVDLRFVRQF
ncbi:surface lipoprotein assembly modifier [Candidatus Spongiihabitans sp.]|uniref:surface lipoprotein assembly modifier n=1 Tax=Candidatus Spongiihabitans sp. TaxID=3101308 RepID=UPI003C7ED14E